jgi:hypothetical protein
MTKAQTSAGWRGVVLLAGVVQGAILTIAPAAVGWTIVHLMTISTLELLLAGAAALLALVAAWVCGYLVLRRRSVPRAAAITWWTTGSTLVITSVSGVIVGFGAVVAAQLTIAMLWSGAALEPVLLAATALQGVATMTVAVSASLVAGGSFLRSYRHPVRSGAGAERTVEG